MSCGGRQCPWHKKQLMETLRHLTIEEIYELGDAILDKDLEEVKKELGDVLLHIVFYDRQYLINCVSFKISG